MSVTITVTLTNAQAKAVLNSEGFTNGYGCKKSLALGFAQLRIIGAIQDAWNAQLDGGDAHDQQEAR